MNIKVLIAEDHDFTRESLIYGLKKHKDIEIVAEAKNGQEALTLGMQHRPDIILMDIGMPILNGIEATKEIKQFNKNIKVLMFTSYKEKTKVLGAFNSGADAYCLKNINFNKLVDVITMVVKGNVWIDSEIAGFVLEFLQTKNINETTHSEKHDFNLTTREKEILKLIADGLSNKDISERLVLSLYTVKNHVSSIIQKLAVDDRTQVAIVAFKENLI